MPQAADTGRVDRRLFTCPQLHFGAEKIKRLKRNRKRAETTATAISFLASKSATLSLGASAALQRHRESRKRKGHRCERSRTYTSQVSLQNNPLPTRKRVSVPRLEHSRLQHARRSLPISCPKRNREERSLGVAAGVEHAHEVDRDADR